MALRPRSDLGSAVCLKYSTNVPKLNAEPNGPRVLLRYTFQLTPASLRFCGMMRQLNFCVGSVAGLTSYGPPARPSGSRVALSQYSRLGSVGPNTEQWYWSQIVNASASR